MAKEQTLLTEAQSDSRRARELYKYYIPQSSAFCTTQNTLPDTVLTSHAQLVAWRLNCQRAMISVIDRETQYFVAESTKTLDLSDASVYDDPSDAIWAGCINVPKAGRLCEHTILELPRPNGDPAIFEVLDLTKDDRFDTLPFVVEAPFFKYYCGVPLRTKKGVAIGSLFALDNKVREPLSRSNQMFLATMAENVMAHYENVKEKEDRKRSLNMNMCLAAFVDPENQIRRHKRHQSAQSRDKPRSEKSTSSVKTVERIATNGDRVAASADNSTPLTPASQTGSDHSEATSASTSLSKRVDEDDHIETFQRAADLLQDSLSLQTGGVVFMDTPTSYRSRRRNTRQSEESPNSSDDSEAAKQVGRRDSIGSATLKSSSSWGPSRMANPPSGSKPTEILAYSPRHLKGDTANDLYFKPLANDDMERLIKRHPRGKLFNLDPENIITSSSDGDEFAAPYEVPKSKKLTSTKAEGALLAKHFPGALQVIFLPLWDASASRFSAFFAYTTSEFRTFSNNPDFLHCIAFCNCVMTEITRLATTAADQQKSDFIGSVSHELRSPLHGILASCEFLNDTDTSSFQKSLIDTADSCARTLLDTINMVLDYSKINAFERNAKKARKKRGQLNTGAMQTAGQPQLNIYGDVDLAAITEEVVEGVATGQVFKDSLTGVDAIDLTTGVSKQAIPGKKDVEIILDIAPRASPRDWTFITQPGAFRRIIMNIFGNSLKYTRQGYIRVRLEAQSALRHKDDPVDAPLATTVRLTITDTGQGMSPQFMRTKLYTPFAQENSIAPGTGLGLSLVKSMVAMLNGEINIQSVVGVGTEVTVKFPMTLSAHAAAAGSSSGTSGSTPTSVGSIERIKDESLQIVQQKTRGRKAMLFPGNPSFADARSQKSWSDSTKMMRDALNRYLTGWFGFEASQPLSPNNIPDIIVTDEADLHDLLKILPTALSRDDGPMIIVLCTATSRRSNPYTISKFHRLEAVSHPFGPYKLAKTIRVCLDKLERSSIMEAASETAIDPTNDSKDFATDEVATAVQQMTITNPDPNIPDVTVIKAGDVVANGDSIHAQLLGESEATNMSGGSQEGPEYPFPIEDCPTAAEIAKTAFKLPEEAAPISAKGIRTTLNPPDHTTPPALPTLVTAVKPSMPRMLLVDDNPVNLRLLQTFMKKRKYADVFSAEDGQQAVSAYRNLLDPPTPGLSGKPGVGGKPPDIIFMDISMPIMNGFEATRRIREIEAEYRGRFEDPMTTPSSSLIIALTGLASGRDQSEAFTSGFDLYLVKPISFREVGRLLDNWETSVSGRGSGGAGGRVPVPSGATVAASPDEMGATSGP
ncbi:hypothetical protein E2P81_ATG10692 [Venturia nashicola]|uniref:Uncharacterized protein n=1 Tax=Venturia nashicola TaxID=86259 RepID=A0A4Z1NNT4_9PEZI|nr:hypothetical protein E6O75_ATG10361 [Venturia nashicola]TLD27404.1 hypothetical protein E2P81_ATG10692 [Venturia nashicola]